MNQRQKMKRRKARRTKNRRERGKVGQREMEKKTSLRAGGGGRVNQVSRHQVLQGKGAWPCTP